MDAFSPPWCLEHNLPEDQMSLWGMVCPDCKRRLYVQPPRGRCRSFWESQPVAFTLDRRPCFAYTLIWDDFRIRTLHAPETEDDLRSQNIPRELPPRRAAELSPEELDPEVFFDGWGGTPD